MKCPINIFVECIGDECPLFRGAKRCDVSGLVESIGEISDMTSMIEDKLSDIAQILAERL